MNLDCSYTVKFVLIQRPELQFVLTTINVGNLPYRKTFPTNMIHILYNKECLVKNIFTSELAQGVFVVFAIDTPLIHKII